MRRALTFSIALLLLLGVVNARPRIVRSARLDCSISSGGFALNQYDVFSDLDSVTVLADAVQYSCNKNSTAVSIALGPSAGTTDYTPREMLKTGGDPLYYYISLGGLTPQCGGGSGQVWGDSSLVNDTVSYFAVSGRRDLPNYVQAYGCIPHGQNVEATVHADLLLVTVSF